MRHKPTVSSDSVAQDQLRAFIERIERMEEEKKAIADDIREIYAEAKGNGFDTVVLRQIVKLRKQDASERMEREALLDLYMGALGMQTSFAFEGDEEPPRRSANLSTTPEPSISSASEPKSAPASTTPIPVSEHQAGQDSGDRPAPLSTSIRDDKGPGVFTPGDDVAEANGGDREVSATNHPGGENANSVGKAGASHPSGHSQADGASGQDTGVVADATSLDRAEGETDGQQFLMRDGAVVARLAHNQEVAGAIPAPATNSEPGEGQIGETPITASRQTAGEGVPSASSVVPFRTKVAERPEGCLHPTVCAGTWRGRCHECQTAFNARAVEIPHHGSVA